MKILYITTLILLSTSVFAESINDMSFSNPYAKKTDQPILNLSGNKALSSDELGNYEADEGNYESADTGIYENGEITGCKNAPDVDERSKLTLFMGICRNQMSINRINKTLRRTEQWERDRLAREAKSLELGEGWEERENEAIEAERTAQYDAELEAETEQVEEMLSREYIEEFPDMVYKQMFVKEIHLGTSEVPQVQIPPELCAGNDVNAKPEDSNSARTTRGMCYFVLRKILAQCSGFSIFGDCEEIKEIVNEIDDAEEQRAEIIRVAREGDNAAMIAKHGYREER